MINVRVQHEGDSIIEYANLFQYKLLKYVTRLGHEGVRVANENKGNENPGSISFEVTNRKNDKTSASCDIVGNGTEVYKEWSTGVTHGRENLRGYNINPLLLAEFGSGPEAIEGHRGTMPGQTHAFEDSWSWRDPVSGEKHTSSGETPTRPMHKASMEIIKQASTVAREVFGS